MWTSSWYTARRLQTQLLLWTALIVTLSVVATMELGVRSNVRLLQENLRDRSETVIRSVKRFLDSTGAIRTNPSFLAALGPELRERVTADRTLMRLDIIRRRDGNVEVVASSASMPEILVHSFSDTPTTEVRELG